MEKEKGIWSEFAEEEMYAILQDNVVVRASAQMKSDELGTLPEDTKIVLRERKILSGFEWYTGSDKTKEEIKDLPDKVRVKILVKSLPADKNSALYPKEGWITYNEDSDKGSVKKL